MSEPFLAEIRIVAFNFVPQAWAFCDGQILPISQNTALFSLIGTSYGGNGVSTFALPNLQGSAPMSSGTGAGLTPRVIGETGGETAVTLLTSQMPTHSHAVNCDAATGTASSPIGGVWAATKKGKNAVNHYAAAPNGTQMNPQCLTLLGGNQPHNNLQPYLTLNFIIALQGIFPSRN